MDGPPEDFRPLGFDTAVLPPPRRFEGWCDLLSRKLLQVEGSADRDNPYFANASLRILPLLRAGTGRFAPSHYNRPRKLAASDSDDFVLMVNHDGQFAANHRNRDIALAPGDAYLMSCADPGSYTRSTAGNLTCVRVGHNALATALPRASDQAGLRIPCDTEGLSLLVQYVQLLADCTLTSSRALDLATDHVHDLSAVVLGAVGDAREEAGKRGLKAALIVSLKAHVEIHLSHADLSPESLAPHFGLSARSIQRLFERDGTTFTEFLRERRLQRVHRMLASRRHDAMSITEITLACGFGDVSHFNRQFRARFGASPRDIRASRD